MSETTPPTPPTDSGSTAVTPEMISQEHIEAAKAYTQSLDELNHKVGILPDMLARGRAGLKQLYGAMEQAIDSDNQHVIRTDAMRNSLNGLNSIVGKTGSTISDVTGYLTKNSMAFGAVGAAVFGAGERFTQFSSSINSGGVQTYSEQIDILGNAFHSAAGKGQLLAAEVLDKIRNIVPGGEMIGKSAEAVLIWAKNAAASADNAVRLQNAMIGLAGASGNLTELYTKAGPHLENMNALIDAQWKTIDQSAFVTGTSTAKMSEYYEALGKIPGASDLWFKALRVLVMK